MNRPPKKNKKIKPTRSMPEEYVTQIDTMARQGHAWVLANADKTPLVQWNFTAEAMIIGTIEDGFERHFITANAEGRLLIAAMCKGFSDVTIFQARTAMEMMEKIVARPPWRLYCPACQTRLGRIEQVLTEKDKKAVSLADSFMICAACGSINYMDASQLLRCATEEELAALDASAKGPVMRAAQKIIHERLKP